MGSKSLKTGCFLCFGLMLFPLLTGCEPMVDTQVVAGGTTVDAAAPVDNTASSGTVCNPFGGGSSGRNQGLKAELYHLPDSLPHYEQVAQYIQNGTKLDATLFFDQVNVPTRPFDAGFITMNGETLKTPSGDTLYEWFALKFQSVVKLTNNDRPGKVQFALIADDGAILKAKVDGTNWVTLVDDDGQHATQLKVSSSPVDMSASSELPIELQYFQGPRMHIAVMVLWREWPTGVNAWKDVADGASGNDYFFNSNYSPSLAQAPYQALLARGWKPVPAANYFLPSEVPENPCPDQPVVTPTETATAIETATATNTNTNTNTNTDTATDESKIPLAITGFDGTTTGNSASLIWQTAGVASTTKVYYGTSAANLNQQLSLGSAKATVHQIEITGLSSETLYYFRAESTDNYGRTALSSVLTKATK